MGLSAGRAEPETLTDRRCEHCGLWFSVRGIEGHQRGCPIEELPHAVFDESRNELYLQLCAECGWSIPETGESAHAEGCDRPGVERKILVDYSQQ
jgi:hypothetical protein